MCQIGNENRRTLTYNIVSIQGGKKADRNNQRFRIKATFKVLLFNSNIKCACVSLSFQFIELIRSRDMRAVAFHVEEITSSVFFNS